MTMGPVFFFRRLAAAATEEPGSNFARPSKNRPADDPQQRSGPRQ